MLVIWAKLKSFLRHMVNKHSDHSDPLFNKYIYSVLVNEMPKSARYHIDRANSIVFTSKRLPLQPVSSERNQLSGLATSKKNIDIVLFHLTLLISTHRFQKTYWTKHYLGPLIWQL